MTTMGMEVKVSGAVCFRCGTAYTKLRGNFPANHAALYKGIGYLPYCIECVEAMYNTYFAMCQDHKKAMRQMCRKLDIYWSEKILEGVMKLNSPRSIVANYLTRVNSVNMAGKSFDDTLTEEHALWLEPVTARQVLAASTQAGNNTVTAEYDGNAVEQMEVPEDVVVFWGPGYTPSMYMELEQRREYWMSKYPEGVELDIGTEALIRQICSLEIDINKARMEGKPIDKYVNSLNTVLGSANLKPVQNVSGGDSANENTPFGVWIKRFEDGKPIPEPDPELEDVDGLIRYFTIWVLGHLCKMLNIKNTYCKLYEDEIAKMRIERPEYVDEDDEAMFNDIFGDSSAEGGG